jgi:hypothetical protein
MKQPLLIQFHYTLTTAKNEFSRVLSPLINAYFQETRPNDRVKAFASGFGGEAFSIPRDEITRLSEINAFAQEDLAALSSQVASKNYQEKEVPIR